MWLGGELCAIEAGLTIDTMGNELIFDSVGSEPVVGLGFSSCASRFGGASWICSTFPSAVGSFRGEVVTIDVDAGGGVTTMVVVALVEFTDEVALVPTSV